MKYLILAPDYTGSCLIDEYKGEIQIEKLNLLKGDEDRIKRWHEEYRKIIPLSPERRSFLSKEIDRLDIEGLEIIDILKKSLKEDVKIKYFSEGKQSFLKFN
jgi:hypothetical protein